MRTIGTLFILALAASGCLPTTALIQGRQVARPTLGYTDHRYYVLRHSHAYPIPRGASNGTRDYAGHVTGTVCGTDVNLEAEYRSSYIEVIGSVQPADISRTQVVRPARLEIRDRYGARRITGSVGDDIAELLAPRAVSHAIDFSFNADRFRGQIGPRYYDLVRSDNDALVGTVRISGVAQPFLLHGASSLWAMPAADQAALLPLMLTCNTGVYAEVSLDNEWQPMLSLDLTGQRLEDTL